MLLNSIFKVLSINLNAQHVNGMTQFGYKRFLDTLEMNFMNSMESQENQEMFFFEVFHFIGPSRQLQEMKFKRPNALFLT